MKVLKNNSIRGSYKINCNNGKTNYEKILLVSFLFLSSLQLIAQRQETKWNKSIHVTPYAQQHSGRYGGVHYQIEKDKWAYYAGLDFHYNTNYDYNDNGNGIALHDHAQTFTQHFMPKLGVAYYTKYLGGPTLFFASFDIFASAMCSRNNQFLEAFRDSFTIIKDLSTIPDLKVGFNLNVGAEIVMSDKIAIVGKFGITSSVYYLGMPFLDGLDTYSFSTGMRYRFLRKNDKYKSN